MLYGTSLMVSYLGTFFKKNRIFAVVAILFMTFISIYSSPQINYDYMAYELVYEGGSNDGAFEWLYTELAQIAFAHGMTYLSFRFWLIGFASVLFIVGLTRLTQNTSFVIFGYSVTSYFADVVQVRHYVMLAMMILAYSFLVKKRMINRIIAIAIGLLAAGVHSLGFMFLLGMFMTMLPLKVLVKVLNISIVGAAILQVFYFFIGPVTIINIVAKIGSLFIGRADIIDKVTSYYVSGTSFGSIVVILLSWLYFGTTLVLIMRGFRANTIGDEKTKEYKQSESRLKIILAVVVVGVLGLSLMNVSLDYSRIVRVAFVFELIGLAVFKLPITRTNNILVKFVTVLFILSLAFYTQNVIYGQDFMEKIPQLVNVTL